MRIFKRQWITQKVIDYLMSIPSIFQVFYVVHSNGTTTPLLFRDEYGNTLADLYERNVVEIRLQFQEDILFESYHVHGQINDSDIPYLKEKFEKFISIHSFTKSNLKLKELSAMQSKLCKEIQRLIGVKSIFNEDDKDITLVSNELPLEIRKKLANLIEHLDNKCICITMQINTSSATDEEIGATLNELALLEMEMNEND